MSFFQMEKVDIKVPLDFEVLYIIRKVLNWILCFCGQLIDHEMIEWNNLVSNLSLLSISIQIKFMPIWAMTNHDVMENDVHMETFVQFYIKGM